VGGTRHHLGSLVDDFERHGSQLAIVARHDLRHRKTTYQELATLSRRFAAELCSRDIRKGDRVLIWGENSAEWVAAFFGCVLRGVLPVPLDFASTTEFANRVHQEVSPKLTVGNSGRISSFASTNATLPFELFEQLPPTPTTCPAVDLSENDALQIVFTSGTTGDPKGIVHTHGNVLASLRPIEREVGKYLKYERFVHPIRILHTLPLSHVFGQFMGLWLPALFAAEVHYESRIVASELALYIRRHRISVLAAVPRVLDLLRSYVTSQSRDLTNRLINGQKLSAWQRWWHFRDVHKLFGLKFWAFVSGGASLSAESEQFWNGLGFAVIQGYGMTETTALVSLNHPFKLARGTIGKVLPGREVRLSDEGEVLVRGDTISNSVWQRGELRHQNSEWLATGDLAEFDDAGNLRFRGRKKDVIVTSSGLNIHPEDLEAALNRQPAIKASVVIERVAEHGPVPVAALVLADVNSDPKAAVADANRTLADFQQISEWIVWPEADLPRTSTGKILRREVLRRISSGEISGGASSAAIDEFENLDSLGRVQLQAQLEQQFGISLDDTALQKAQTPEDLRQLVAQAPQSSLAKPEADEHLYPHWPWNTAVQAIRALFLEAIAMPLVRLLTKTRVKNQITHWPSSPVLIVANHVTSYDVPFILYALPGRLRTRVGVAMSGEMILDWRRSRNNGNWFLDALGPLEYLVVTALFNIFPLPQRSGFRRSFQHAGEAIDNGYSVIIFPEGRRSDDGLLQPFKLGAGLLWKELGTAALPVRLEGLGEIKAQAGHWFRSGQITVKAGELLKLDAGRSPEELTAILRQTINQL